MSEKALPSISSLGEVAEPIEPDLQTDTLTIPMKLCNLPPLNSIALQAMSLTADEDIDLRRIASVVEDDPAFAAECCSWRTRRCSAFPARMHVLHQAVAVLGLDRIKALLCAAHTRRAGATSSGPAFPVHSVAPKLLVEVLYLELDSVGVATPPASGLSERNHFSTSAEEFADSIEALAPESSGLGGGIGRPESKAHT